MADITWNGDAILAELRDAEVRGLTLAAEHLLQVSRDETPNQEGNLERSGTATVDAEGRAASVSFDTPYSVRQHEELTYRHEKGKAKYLEDPYNAERETMLELIAAQARRALR